LIVFRKSVLSNEAAPSIPVRQKKQAFLRSVRVSLTIRSFTGAKSPE